MEVSNKNEYSRNMKVNREDNCKHRNAESYPDSALQGLRPVSLQNPARAFPSTKNLVHQTIFDQEIASPTLSSTVWKIVTQ